MACTTRIPVSLLPVLLVSAAWVGCAGTTATSLSQTSDGVTRSLPRAGDVLQLAPDNVEGEALVDFPGAPGQPSLRIVTGTVKVDLVSQSVGFVTGPPAWAEVVLRFSIAPKSPLRGTLNASNGIASVAAFDAPSGTDATGRIGFSVKGVTIEQLPSGEIILFARVAVRGLTGTALVRLAYQANLLWTPGGALPTAEPPSPGTPTPK